MNENPSYNLAELAFKNKELDKLFLGIEPYIYMPRFSYATGNIDLNTVIPDGIFPYINQGDNLKDTGYLNQTLNILSKNYSGLMPVANFIVCSTIYKKDHKKMPTEIDNDQLIQNLKETISQYQKELRHDHTDEGFGHKEGKYEYFKNLSVVVQKMGGPNFFPEENHQDESVKI